MVGIVTVYYARTIVPSGSSSCLSAFLFYTVMAYLYAARILTGGAQNAEHQVCQEES